MGGNITGNNWLPQQHRNNVGGNKPTPRQTTGKPKLNINIGDSLTNINKPAAKALIIGTVASAPTVAATLALKNSKTLLNKAQDAAVDWVNSRSSRDWAKYTRKTLNLGVNNAQINKYVKQAEANGGNILTKFDRLTNGKNSSIGRLFRKTKAIDDVITRKAVKSLNKGVNKFLNTKGNAYYTEKGILRDIANNTNRYFTDIIEQNAKELNKKYKLATQLKDSVLRDAKTLNNRFLNSRIGKFTKGTWSKITDSKFSGIFKSGAKVAGKPGIFSKAYSALKGTGNKAFNAFKGTRFGAALTTNAGAKLGLVCRGLSRFTTVLQVGLAVYEIGDACVKGYKEGGIKGLIKTGGQQTVKSGCGLAGGIAGMKIGAAIGSFGGPLGMLVGGAVGAFAGYIAGSAVGGAICKAAGAAWKGIKAAGKWIGETASKAWNATKKLAGKVADGVKKVGQTIANGAKKVLNFLTSW